MRWAAVDASWYNIFKPDPWPSKKYIRASNGKAVSVSAFKPIGIREAEALLGEFEEICSRQASQQLRIFDWWLPQYRSWIACAGRFNVFEALQMQSDEIRHSRFLAFLLDPSGRHDQRACFLRSFLDLIDRGHFYADPALNSCRVYVELWTGDLGRLDIAICFPDGEILAIENKVWAAEQENQVARYQRWVHENRRGPVDRSAVVFLNPAGDMPQTHDPSIPITVKPLSYTRLAEWLGEVAEDMPSRVKEVIHMYSNVCRAIGRQVI